MMKKQAELNEDLTLNWLNKDNSIYFEISENNEVINVNWVKSDGEKAPEDLVEIEKDRDIMINLQDLNNVIIHGQYSHTLRILSEYFRIVSEENKVQCAIFAPPLHLQDPSLNFLTKEQFLTFSRNQLHNVKQLIKNSGFVIVHTFEPIYPELKIVLDEIFGRNNYIGTIIWKKLEESKLFSHIGIGTNQYYKHLFDYLAIYSKDENLRKFNKFPPKDLLYKNPDNDPRGPWESRPLIASEKSNNEEYTYTFRNGLKLTRKFRYARETLKRYEFENRIHFTKPKNGQGIPRLKVFFSDRMETYKKTGESGTTPNSLWIDNNKYGSIQSLLLNLKKHPTLSINKPFRTEKLYKKLLYLTSLENDLILDCFCQLGVIVKCAHELNRKWIAIEPNIINLQNGILPWVKNICPSIKDMLIKVITF
jgi:adenine-specific DNA-methyltransferase